MAGPGKPGRRRTLAQVDKDAKTLALHLQGKTYRQIMVVQGFKSTHSVHAGIKRALADRQKSVFEQVDWFTMAVERIQNDIAEQEKIIATLHYVTSTTGKLVMGPDGQPMLDDAPKARALEAKMRLYDQLNKLQGNYAPSKSRQEVVTQDVVDAQIQAELDVIRKMADAGEAPGPGVVREP